MIILIMIYLMGFQRYQSKTIQGPLISQLPIHKRSKHLGNCNSSCDCGVSDVYLIILEINKMWHLGCTLMFLDFSVSSWFQNPHLPSFGILKTFLSLPIYWLKNAQNVWKTQSIANNYSKAHNNIPKLWIF